MASDPKLRLKRYSILSSPYGEGDDTRIDWYRAKDVLPLLAIVEAAVRLHCDRVGRSSVHACWCDICSAVRAAREKGVIG